MTLIEGLRYTASKGVSVWGDLQVEAADEIERLQAELAAHKAANRMALEALIHIIARDMEWANSSLIGDAIETLEALE